MGIARSKIICNWPWPLGLHEPSSTSRRPCMHSEDPDGVIIVSTNVITTITSMTTTMIIIVIIVEVVIVKSHYCQNLCSKAGEVRQRERRF